MTEEILEFPVRCVEFIESIRQGVKEASLKLLKMYKPIGFIVLPPEYALLCGSKICWMNNGIPSPDEEYGLRFGGIPVRGFGNGSEGIVCVPFEFLRDLHGVISDGQARFDLPAFSGQAQEVFDELMKSPAWCELYEKLLAERQMAPWAIEFMNLTSNIQKSAQTCVTTGTTGTSSDYYITVYTNGTAHCTNVVDHNGKLLGCLAGMTLLFGRGHDRVHADIEFADGKPSLKSVPVMGIKSFDEYEK